VAHRRPPPLDLPSAEEKKTHREEKRTEEKCRSKKNKENQLLAAFLFVLQVTAGVGRQGGGRSSRSTGFCHLHRRRRVSPRAASVGGAWEDAPPLFMLFQKGFPAISGVLGTVL